MATWRIDRRRMIGAKKETVAVLEVGKAELDVLADGLAADVEGVANMLEVDLRAASAALSREDIGARGGRANG